MYRNCINIQQNLYENLGNRDYDCFQESEEKYLKLKIGYSLFGTPKNENAFNNFNDDYTAEKCYNDKQNVVINNYIKIIKTYSKYYEDPTLLFTSFMFNCLLDISTYEINYYPIFRVKKCSGSPYGIDCCEYIDEHLRVYKNWKDYLENNKLPKGVMCVPTDGKYQCDASSKVLVNIIDSPALSLKADLKKVGDITTTVASLASGSIAIASLIPAITIAPFLLTGALLTGAGVGIYSAARSSIELKDRKAHRQSISIKNEQARNCYLNIAAGATSVVTTGATKAATLALNRGIIISETAAATLLSVNAVNMTINGCNVANSLYKVVNDVQNNKKPSAIDIMHLTTTVLFFGNAVVNLRSACVIYKDAQSKPFSELIKIRSQELWNQAKEKFFGADVTTHENNSSLKLINDPTDYCQLLTPLQERGTSNTAVKLLKNFITSIDIDDALHFAKLIIKNKENVRAFCLIILRRFENKIQEVLLKLVEYLLKNVIKEAFEPLEKIFPQTEKLVILLNFIINFLKYKVSKLEIEYHSIKADTLRSLDINEDEYERTRKSFKNSGDRVYFFFEKTALKMIHNETPEETLCKEMVKIFWEWLGEKRREYKANKNNPKTKNNGDLRYKMRCDVCRGYYYNYYRKL